MSDDQNSPSTGGSGKYVDDFSPYCEGDIEPSLKKKINTLVDSDNDYIIYLDDELFVEYSWTPDYGKTPDGFSDIANTVAHLEGLSVLYLSSDHLPSFRRMLGEAMARIVGDKDLVSAREALDIAISFMNARSLERVRVWYLEASAAALAVFMVAAFSLWSFRTSVIAAFGMNTFHVCLGGALGALGSFLSIWIKPSRIRMDAGALKRIHQWEGVARIVVGVACAFSVALAIKGEIILPISGSSHQPLAFLLVVCIAAGFSERAFLNLIGHFNDPDLQKGKKAQK